MIAVLLIAFFTLLGAAFGYGVIGALLGVSFVLGVTFVDVCLKQLERERRWRR